MKQSLAIGQGPALRLDAALVAKGCFASRTKAREAIEAGLVTVEGRVVLKPAAAVAAGTTLEAAAPYPWVSRGGVKLAAGLDFFDLSPDGRVCLDVGASTGGFTDVLLSRGASHVHAVDVGRDQLHPRIKRDTRVTERSETDIRSLQTADLQPAPSFVVCDVSFISLAHVLPAALALATPSCELLALIKPQFEVGPGRTVKGIVRDAELRSSACARITALLATLHMDVQGVVPSPLPGGDGNLEFLIAARRP